eukprot:gnl/Dysnectes_brevis/1203_a1345_3714.p1 GENE.gnl/Dysnectes_brevis/1203_a1345_3714~~gnl/Dysnectes_brevis/1203_a1345_3714.p1  ORF type:complete len:411 (+),score=145.02 gnl/Dysnectes_brevis/1203_a1345_3714:54-1286(+)
MLNIISLFLFACLVFQVQAQISNFNLKKERGWVFLSKFCFNGDNLGKITLQLDSEETNVKIYFYADASGTWEDVYKQTDQCSLITSDDYAVRSFKPGVFSFNVEQMPAPHFWYAAVALCDDKDFSATGSIHWEDIQASGKLDWDTEWSFTEQILMEGDTVFTILFMSLFVLQAYTAVSKFRGGRHMIIIIVLGTSALFAAGLWLQDAFNAHYAQYGQGMYIFRNAAVSLMCMGEAGLILVTLLLGQGWLISSAVVPHFNRTLVISAIMAIVSSLFMIWAQLGAVTPSSLCAYDTVPGIIFLVIRTLIGLLFFVQTARSKSGESYPDRKALYSLLQVVAFAWYLVPTVITLIALILPNWFRNEFTLMINLLGDFLMLLCMAYLVHPAVIELNFSVSSGVRKESNTDTFLEM